MNIVIDNVDFWDNFEAQKYYSPPKTMAYETAKEKIKECILSEAYLGSTKRDGIWSMIIKDTEGNFHLRSRTKNVRGTFDDKSEWIPLIISAFQNLPNGTVFLGEIYKENDEGSRKATAILNCLKEKSLARQEKTPLIFYCFDCLAYNNQTLLNTAFEKRIQYLYNYIKPIAENNRYIECAEYFQGKKLLNECYRLLSEGYEGMVIQKKTSLYLCGKRKAWESVKIKQQLSDTIDAFLDGDYKPATRLYSGKEIETWPYWHNPKTNKFYNTCQFASYSTGTSSVEPITKAYYYGWASAVSFSVMKDGKPVHIGYISGITDELKEGIVKNPEKWIGKVAALQAMMVEKIDGNYSLRHARIDSWRDDKQKEDCDFSQITSS